MILDFDAGRVFQENWAALNDPNIRIVVNRGGTRSGKSYSIAQMFIMLALTSSKPVVVDFVRKTLPALKATVYRDVLEIMHTWGVYDQFDHNKSDRILRNIYTGCELCFYSVDDPQKIRGRKRDFVNISEANEIDMETFNQILFRTVSTIVIDFNPSDEFVWINTALEKKRIHEKEDVKVIVSTYLDNPFLPDEIISEIEYLKQTDEQLWEVYGKGNYGKIKGLIFPNVSAYGGAEQPKGKLVYGLDFGFTNSYTALIECVVDKNEIFLKELIYERGLLASEIAQKMKQLGIPNHATIIADNARPETIAELKQYGFNVKPCKKGKDSLVNGITYMKSKRLYVHEQSVNLQREFNTYKWAEDKEGNAINEPVKLWDHGIDAARYAITSTKRGKVGSAVV